MAPLTFEFDRQKVAQLVSNLLENALRFTPRGGTVSLTAIPYFWERRSLGERVAVERRVVAQQRAQRGQNHCRRQRSRDSSGESSGDFRRVLQLARAWSSRRHRSGADDRARIGRGTWRKNMGGEHDWLRQPLLRAAAIFSAKGSESRASSISCEPKRSDEGTADAD